ncbi:MAG: hypothetical protein NT038_05300 [Euryarchaeota archaeon]|nr:hypothetical protein [Euryarchaeota archaeon]
MIFKTVNTTKNISWSKPSFVAVTQQCEITIQLLGVVSRALHKSAVEENRDRFHDSSSIPRLSSSSSLDVSSARSKRDPNRYQFVAMILLLQSCSHGALLIKAKDSYPLVLL